MRTQTVHFSVAGEFITEHARNLIAEGRTGGAWLLLQTGLPGMTADQIASVLCGRKKLVGVNNVDLVDDDLKADPAAFMEQLMRGLDAAQKVAKAMEEYRGYGGLCHHVFHPPLKGKVPMRGSPVGLITESRLERVLAPMFPLLLMEVFPRFKDREWEEFWTTDRIELFDEGRDPGRGGPMSEDRYNSPGQVAVRAGKTIALMGKKPTPDIDAWMLREKMMDERPTPKADKTYKSDNGWVLPDGKFYPCAGPMEHIWLADRLKNFSEKQAEDSGWVKVSLSPMFGDVHIISHKKPTQSQINTLFDWSKNREPRALKYESWLESWRNDE